MTAVALGLGSNKKFSNLCPEEILGSAVFEISKILHGVEISSVYRTKAMYVSDQEDFYNMALVGFLDDGISARALLEKTQAIEAAFGRDREKEIRFGPRSLDIDIEFFGDQKILEDDLQIPHPRLKERAFVLVPLLEVFDSIESARSVNQGANPSLNESQIISTNATAQCADAPVARATSSITSSNATTGTVDEQASRAVGSIISTNATALHVDAPVARATVSITSSNATTGTVDEQASREAVSITSSKATACNADAPVARATVSITSSNATTGTVDAQTAQAVGSIISSKATACNADNINGKIFCFSRDEIFAALSSLGESGGVEKIIRAQDFLPFIKSRLQNGTSSR